MDAGPHNVVEPKTQQLLECNVISSTWNQQPSYAIYLYEQPANRELSGDSLLRRQRMHFNSAIFNGNSNDMAYYQDGFKGYYVWNITQDRCVMAVGWPTQSDGNIPSLTFDELLRMLQSHAVSAEDRAFFQTCTREWIIAVFEAGKYPRELSVQLQTSKGRIVMALEAAMMRSPDNDDLYLKISQENITHKAVGDMLLKRTIHQRFDYLAYIDALADECRVIYGETANQTQAEVVYSVAELTCSDRGQDYHRRLLGQTFSTVEALFTYLGKLCGDNKEYSSTYEMADGRIKRIVIWMIDLENRIFCIQGTDVTALLQAERQRERELEQAVIEERNKVERVTMQTILSISRVLDARDESTCQHSQRVAFYSAKIANRLHWPKDRVDNLYNIALVHDIGKIGIPDALLLKSERLTAQEFELIKLHVTIGCNILKDFTSIELVSQGALLHHERYDGKGYPDGLVGEDIPIEARIIGIADAVDAMNSSRSYRQRQSKAYIVSELTRERGHQFDPALVDVMLSMIDEDILSVTLPYTVFGGSSVKEAGFVV